MKDIEPIDSERQLLIRQGKDASIVPMDYSRLNIYEMCPAQYNLRYNKRLPSTTGDAAKLGQVAHNFLELYTTKGLKAAKAYVSAMMPLGRHADLERIQEAITEIEWKGPPYSTERRFHFYAEIAGKTVQFEAKIDILFIDVESSTVEIVDGKTGRQLKSSVEDDAQGLFYALACLRSDELEPFDFQNFLFTQAQFQVGKLVSANFSLERIQRFERFLYATVEKIISTEPEKFKAQPGPHCHWCPYVASSCPVGQTIAPELLRVGNENIKIRATSHSEAVMLAGHAMYLEALVNRMKSALKGYMGSNGDQDIECDSGKVSIEIIKTLHFRGGTSGVLARHPEEGETMRETHYSKLTFKRLES